MNEKGDHQRHRARHGRGRIFRLSTLACPAYLGFDIEPSFAVRTPSRQPIADHVRPAAATDNKLMERKRSWPLEMMNELKQWHPPWSSKGGRSSKLEGAFVQTRAIFFEFLPFNGAGNLADFFGFATRNHHGSPLWILCFHPCFTHSRTRYRSCRTPWWTFHLPTLFMRRRASAVKGEGLARRGDRRSLRRSSPPSSIVR